MTERNSAVRRFVLVYSVCFVFAYGVFAGEEGLPKPGPVGGGQVAFDVKKITGVIPSREDLERQGFTEDVQGVFKEIINLFSALDPFRQKVEQLPELKPVKEAFHAARKAYIASIRGIDAPFAGIAEEMLMITDIRYGYSRGSFDNLRARDLFLVHNNRLREIRQNAAVRKTLDEKGQADEAYEKFIIAALRKDDDAKAILEKIEGLIKELPDKGNMRLAAKLQGGYIMRWIGDSGMPGGCAFTGQSAGGPQDKRPEKEND